jgi:hypothetical protein
MVSACVVEGAGSDPLSSSLSHSASGVKARRTAWFSASISPGAEFAAFIQREQRRWKEVVLRANIKAD